MLTFPLLPISNRSTIMTPPWPSASSIGRDVNLPKKKPLGDSDETK